jgi:hypothetical protein
VSADEISLAQLFKVSIGSKIAFLAQNLDVILRSLSDTIPIRGLYFSSIIVAK